MILHKKAVSASRIRTQNDVSTLISERWVEYDFPDPNDLMNLNISILPGEGYWNNSKIGFKIVVPDDYPFSSPKVTCTSPIFHPNIDLEGNVCMNILRLGWFPHMSLNTIVFGLLNLLISLDSTDPLNHEAADLMRDKPKLFAARAGRVNRLN
jgi:ubiquitin-conjugating enzyme E2 M